MAEGGIGVMTRGVCAPTADEMVIKAKMVSKHKTEWHIRHKGQRAKAEMGMRKKKKRGRSGDEIKEEVGHIKR